MKRYRIKKVFPTGIEAFYPSWSKCGAVGNLYKTKRGVEGAYSSLSKSQYEIVETHFIDVPVDPDGK